MRWWDAGETVGVGTVVGTLRSAPRRPGRGDAGRPRRRGRRQSVSGGCVEGAVYELGQEVRRQRGAPVLQRYGVSDDDAFAVGLTCGGIIDIFVERVDRDVVPGARRGGRRHRGRASRWRVATVVAHPDPARVGRRLVVWPDGSAGSLGSLGSERADDAVRRRRPRAAGRRPHRDAGLRAGRASGAARGCGCSSPSYAPAPRMLVFGAIDFAAAVARVG